eukprot:CAMPEP_0206182780 /NCGR_PEP_ID=MMETSP0166-20121206/260_1 /ASSEMBLY_ACC=CAM_ASM_000260 /TAXON_ID=95228 /ORGANISM="Vannella robusta, Strain DIVA3 518/3/11/1/6" /LENGTH=84 /DNA_ID=CAMNT_0053597537 /DNA_START=34 /DNA_END=288 /DNA_ORIENTATION=-
MVRSTGRVQSSSTSQLERSKSQKRMQNPISLEMTRNAKSFIVRNFKPLDGNAESNPNLSHKRKPFVRHYARVFTLHYLPKESLL